MRIRVSRKPRDAYQHGDLREALVQAGLKLLGEGGMAGLSLRAAAQLAGVSHAAPYRHFRDKEALVGAIAERGFRLLTASMRAEIDGAAARTPDARTSLVAAGMGYLRFALEHPAYLQVIFGGILCQEPGADADLDAAGADAYRTLRDIVEGGLARGELRGGDPDLLALACWSQVHGFATLLINGAIKPRPDAAAAGARLASLLELIGQGVFEPA